MGGVIRYTAALVARRANKPTGTKRRRPPPKTRRPGEGTGAGLPAKPVRLRQLVSGDYRAIHALQLKCFPQMDPWTQDQFESQLRTFPEGQIGIEYDGVLVASAASLIVDFDLYSDWEDWQAISDNGYIRNHDPEGDTLYGIEIMVDPAYRGYRLSRRLYDARKQLVRERGLERIVLGGRLPGYAAHASEMTASQYAERVIAKELYDPVLTAQLANGFQLRRIIADYLPEDRASHGYATFLEWVNLEQMGGPKRMRAVLPVRIGVVQYQMRPVSSFDDFATHCEYFVDAAADQKADFLLFPELFTTQLLSITHADRPGLAARALAEYTPRCVELFTHLAIRYNVNLIAGSSFTVEGDFLYNVSYLVRRDGTVAEQKKVHITPSERRWWGVAPGDRVDVFDTDRGRIAIFICYDIEFPEMARIAAKKGARILFVPFNTDDRNGYLRVRCCAQARCIENHVYVATSGCTGNLPNVENADIHYAQSAIFTPSDISFSRDGIAAECTPNIETVLIHDLDLELLRRHRFSGTTQNWNDRRRDLYRVAYNEDGEEKDV